MLGAWQIFHGCDSLYGAEVDDEQVGQVGARNSLPIGGLLQVESLVARVVAVGGIFRVSVFRCPRLTADTVALGILEIEFSDGGEVFATMITADEDSQEAALLWLVEADGLPTVAGL